MIPTIEQLKQEFPKLLADKFILRREIRDLRAENDRLRTIIRLMRDPDIARAATINTAEPDRPSFNWRHVLFNPQFGWPADVVAEAEAMKRAELQNGLPRSA